MQDQELQRQSYNGWIPKEYIESFSQYKYKSPHKTYCEGVVMDKFWEMCLHYIPTFIAPNLITMSGLVVVAIGVLAMVIEDPTMTQQLSTWIYVYLAVAIWIYQLFDNLDGKQARKTGSSSVLGELFDHGCDAVTCLLLALIYCHIFSYGASFSS